MITQRIPKGYPKGTPRVIPNIIDRFRQLSNEIWKLCWNYLKDPNMEKALLIIYPNETKLCRKFRTFLAFFEKKIRWLIKCAPLARKYECYWRENFLGRKQWFWDCKPLGIRYPWELPLGYPWDTLGVIILEICFFQHEDVWKSRLHG